MNSKHQPVGRWIRVEKRLAIYLRVSFLCLYCQRDLHAADPRDIALDHIIPKVDGGSNRENNLITACRSCNCRRQDAPVERFAGPETVAHIRRNLARDLKPFVTMAKALIGDKTGSADR